MRFPIEGCINGKNCSTLQCLHKKLNLKFKNVVKFHVQYILISLGFSCAGSHIKYIPNNNRYDLSHIGHTLGALGSDKRL